jgi:hypothetical protein
MWVRFLQVLAEVDSPYLSGYFGVGLVPILLRSGVLCCELVVALRRAQAAPVGSRWTVALAWLVALGCATGVLVFALHVSGLLHAVSRHHGMSLEEYFVTGWWSWRWEWMRCPCTPCPLWVSARRVWYGV